MPPLIRIDLEQLIQSGDPFVIDLGCGRKKKPGRIAIDKMDLPHVDIVADIEKGLPFLPDRCVDAMHCRSVLEHVRNFENLMREMVRVLKPNGRVYVFVPHFSNPYFYSDYTHQRPFGLYSFYYFVERKNQLRRTVPDFYTDVRIDLLSLRLVFRSPFWLSRHIKKAIGWIFNLHPRLMEFYELHLCYLFPCDGIEIVFTGHHE